MAEGEVLFVRGEKSKAQVENSGEDEDSTTTADDDIWDDTALVQAYDQAVALAKEEVERRMGLQKESAPGNKSGKSNKIRRKKKKNNKTEWHVGDACRAVYSEDGLVYECTIDTLLPHKETCVVTFTGYHNQEEVPLKMLQRSEGQAARKIQEMTAAQESETCPLQNGLDMECSDGQSPLRSHSRTVPKSPQGTRMDWEAQTGRQPGPSFYPNLEPPRMPPMGVPPMVVPPPPPPHLTASFPEEDAEALSAMLMSWYMSGFHTGYYQGLKQAKTFLRHSGQSNKNSKKK